MHSRSNSGRSLLLCLVAGLLFAPAALGDQETCALGENEAPDWGAIVLFSARGCLGGGADETAVTTAVREAIEVDPDDWHERRAAVATALAQLEAYAIGRAAPSSALSSGFEEMVADLKAAVRALGSGEAVSLPGTWHPDLNQGRPIPVLDMPVKTKVDESCSNAAADCREQFEAALELLRIAVLAEQSLNVSEGPLVSKMLQELTTREKQWTAYFSQARSQYLWELLLNGALLSDSRKRVRSGFTECVDWQAADCVPVGFRESPTSQIILLHPDLALEYVDTEPGGNQFEEAVQVEMIGWNRWRWKADGNMGFALGGSIVATLSDRATADDLAWGALIHIDHRWSIGVTDRSGDLGILASADLAKLWTKASEKRKAMLAEGRGTP